MTAAVDRSNLPPMLAQYLSYKDQYSDCLLFFQVGDFYELFFEDAVTVSKALNLTLTSRDKNNPNPVPMCGVPVGVVDNYAERLVAQGHSVALVSQAEAPGTGKGMVARKLDRIITPGIKILASSAGESGQCTVAALYADTETDGAVAYADVQTGRVWVKDDLALKTFYAELVKLAPTELVVPRQKDGKRVDRRTPWLRELDAGLRGTVLRFRADNFFERSTRDLGKLSGYSALGSTAKKAVKLLLDYVDETTVGLTVPFNSVLVAKDDRLVSIDATTRTNLELVKNSRDGSVQGSLLDYMNLTCTVCGEKLLRQWILAPLCDALAISERLTAVRLAKHEHTARGVIRGQLKFITDLERLAARIELGVVSPKELGELRAALVTIPEIKASLAGMAIKESAVISALARTLPEMAELKALLQNALADNPPTFLNEGGIIRRGYNAELDRLAGLKEDGCAWIAQLEARERERTGISSLKIKFNNVFGYYIEITNANKNKTPSDYIRRQTTANGERYTTDELKKYEQDVLGAEEKQIKLERTLFDVLRKELLTFCSEVRTTSAALAELDVLLALAELADLEGLHEPQINDSLDLRIEEGKHPVLAKLLGSDFVPNSLEMKSQKGRTCFVLTGPNMGGKSTYLRQAALIVIMAQVGSFVPAKSAAIGVVDKIFARIGASDNMREGDSTFMVEMKEAAYIVANATERSLILVDELGRGTATSDGLSLAQAILEWITVELKSRTLFATHFHELTELSDLYKNLGNLSVGSVEKGAHLVFTHHICEGAANKSYGLEVARLAGIPRNVLNRASQLFASLEAQKSAAPAKQQLALFARPVESFAVPATVAVPKSYEGFRRLATRVRDLDLNSLRPLEAMQMLDSWQKEISDESEFFEDDSA